MLNRFRRGSAKGQPTPTNNKFGRSSLRRNNNNSRSNNNDENSAEHSLRELQDKLDRLELLTLKIESDVKSLAEGGTGNDGEKKRGERSAVVDNDNINKGNSSENDNEVKVATDVEQSAKFAPISKNDELEMIELLRRIAELVVLSERRAGQILSEVAAINYKKKQGNNSGDGADSDNVGTVSMVTEDSALPYLALFELFCERNVLANIVNIVTGAAFVTSSGDTGEGSMTVKGEQLYLPPLSIATQAIQSVSILIQNVSRATSLYLLLSNNRVNDLIRLPLDLYKLAEWNRLHNRTNQQQQQQQRVNLMTFTTPEIGELTTHFVSFLKSLAMRVNAETLQFFLSFPMSFVSDFAECDINSNGGSDNNDGIDENVEDDENDVSESDGIEKKDTDDSIASTTASVESDSSVPRSPPMQRQEAPAIAELRQPAYMEQRQHVDFPLYSRALEFCSSEQDSFVRVTAMNVCMNIIRLATVEETFGGDENEDDQSAHSNEVPTGALHEALRLPLQDRIAIAQYACHPRRVGDLISPLCSRLTSQFGQVEGAVRALEELNNATIVDNENIRSKSNKSTTPQRNTAKKRDETRDRLISHIRDLIANVQDELLLLDDLLQVGLISLNEQAIEMMLATFVYPMLLQPLLLPLRRFSSSEDGTESTPKKSRKPTISLQSPPPFSPKLRASEPQSEEPTANTTNGKELHSSDDMDLAPSKTALFGLSVIFHAMSNPTFSHLLLTALLHPFSPEASGGLVISCPPQITISMDPMKGSLAGKPDDNKLVIRMEKNEEESEEFQRVVPVYTFGTKPNLSLEVDSEKERDCGDSANTCIFILAPALVDMLRNHTGCSDTETNSAPTPTRPNPYRSLLISAINGTEEMVSLQSLAIVAAQSALTTVEKSVFKRILFASKQVKENGNDEYLEETMKSLCHSVINKSVTYDGWWKVNFNTAAARTLMDTIFDDFASISFVNDIMTDIRAEAVKYLTAFPSLIEAKSKQSDSSTNGSHNKEHFASWLIDRFFFDPPDKSTNSAVEGICYLKERANDSDSRSQYRYGLEVLSTISIKDSTDILCESFRVVENMLVSESSGNTPFHCAASWAVACLYLDAFCIKIAKLKATIEGKSEHCLSPQRRLSYITPSPSDDTLDPGVGMRLAHLSSKFAIAMLDESESSESAPAHGSVVGLIGKAAFPCVCEVSSNFSYLFSGRSSVLSEGIQWQSLYLVVVGKWAVLAEPERGGTGGDGRVITSCRLSCLTLRKDTSSQASNNSPARRLLVAHSSLEPRLPALFSFDPSSKRRNSSGRSPSLGPDGLRLTRSRMDLWFEDSNAAGHAYKVLSSKIAKARAKRGGNIKAALLAR